MPLASRVVVQPPSPKARGGFADFMDLIEHEILAVTYFFEPAPSWQLQTVVVRFSGLRAGVTGRLGAGDRFVQDETIRGIAAGSGPISITARVRGINAGEWQVMAKIEKQIPEVPWRDRRTIKLTTPAVHPGDWSWLKWRLSKRDPAQPVKTCIAPFAPVPGVLLLSYAAMVTLAIVVALVLQAYVISRDHVTISHALPLSLLAIASGVIGAKVWFIVIHRRESRRLEGWCIQGFLAGVAVAALIGFATFRAPIGEFLDATAPGALFGMAIGRLGCFFGGCCAGKSTASRWGIWSSMNQRVGMRRIPTQWIELLVAFGVGLGALVVVLTYGPRGGGVFVGALAAYTLIRQGILRLREEGRQSTLGPALTAALAAVVLVADILVFALVPGLRIV